MDDVVVMVVVGVEEAIPDAKSPGETLDFRPTFDRIELPLHGLVEIPRA